MSTPPPGAADGAEKLRLKVVEGNAVGTLIEVEEDGLVIGRQAEGAGALSNDIELSRQHARIASQPDGRYVIEDLGSTNGTYVDGRRIESPTVLEAGDRIEVGATALVVQLSAAALSPTPPSSDTVAASTLPEAGPAPSPQAEPETGPTSPVLKLQVEVDLEAGEATVALDDDDAAVKLVHEDGRWRLAE